MNTEWVSGNIFIRPTTFQLKGDFIQGHQHNFDHTTIVFKGGVHVEAKSQNGGILERDFIAPSHFLVKSNVEHKITALEDNTVFWCVYSHHTPQGTISQEFDGWDKAYG